MGEREKVTFEDGFLRRKQTSFWVVPITMFSVFAVGHRLGWRQVGAVRIDTLQWRIESIILE